MSTKIFRHIFAALALATIAGSCLKNDIPYARIQANILEIAAEGQSSSARIDSLTRTVNFYFPEEVDITKVRLESWKVADNVTVLGDSLNMVFNLATPATVTLRIYQDYQWTLIANQTIERSFVIADQIGTSTIDIPGRRVVAYINQYSDIKSVLVEKCKLGPEGWDENPELTGQRVDFTDPVEITVDYYGTPQTWLVYVEPTASAVTTVRADAWTNVAWVYGDGQAGTDVGVQYRLAGDTEWTTAPADWVTVNGGSFYACLRHLSPDTQYEARAYSGTDFGAMLSFTTGSVLQLPNSDFEQWWLDGKVWYPWAEGGTPYWGTGNKGATTLGPSNSGPTDDTPSGTGYAAKLETRFVGVSASLGKLAAGNLFTGTYVKTDGTNGILSFGREFEQRPTAATGYFKYVTAPISSVTDGFEDYKGRPDTCIIWVALIDSPEPFEIRTNPKNRHLFDPNGSEVVAYGSFELGEDVTQYTPFRVELNYKSTQRKPKYIIWTCSASKYGDYFTGGDGAILWVDDFELIYDY